MKTARPNIQCRSRRRGVTLLEMLVTVALLLLMMSIIVAVFQTATGSITVSKAYAQLEQEQRRLNTIIRQDLSGVTCRMTPSMNDPVDNRGYFEYGENALSDAQDEDSDDTLRFTAQAPDGRPFTGRMWVPKSVAPSDGGRYGQPTLEPIPVTSQYAEIIYFLRGDKLYRRVRLIMPTTKLGFAPKFAPPGTYGPWTFSSPSLNFGNTPTDPSNANSDGRGSTRFGFRTNLFEPVALFRPFDLGGGASVSPLVGGIPYVSWQGLNDVSAHPSEFRPATTPEPNAFLDYAPIANTLGDLTDRHNRFASPRFANDFRTNTAPFNLIPDHVYDDMNADGIADYHPNLYFNSKNVFQTINGQRVGLLNDTFAANDPARPLTPEVAGFPWVFPNAFTGNGTANQLALGRIHAPDPSGATFNHNPLASGDSLPVPDPANGGGQTWYGFPTWRETMSPTWLDPIKRINDPQGAPYYSDPIVQAMGEAPYVQTRGLSPTVTTLLPPQPGPFSDNLPAPGQPNAFDFTFGPVFEDDLIAINVRSFNIKAFDPNRFARDNRGTVDPSDDDVLFFNGSPLPDPGYDDLGYASARFPVRQTWGQTPSWMLNTLGHEGRMPPLVADNRVDAHFPTFTDPSTGNVYPAGLGDDTATLTRLRRTWDSWSTTYSNAPSGPLDPSLAWPYCGPLGGGRSIIPSYPAPYQVPLRGIEIQIRLTDPGSQYVKTLTIRQDFSDKL